MEKGKLVEGPRIFNELKEEHIMKCKPCLTQMVLDKANERIVRFRGLMFNARSRVSEIESKLEELYDLLNSLRDNGDERSEEE